VESECAMAECGSDHVGQRSRFDARSGPKAAQAVRTHERYTCGIADAMYRSVHHLAAMRLAISVEAKQRLVGTRRQRRAILVFPSPMRR
jgi:hypothetical protein